LAHLLLLLFVFFLVSSFGSSFGCFSGFSSSVFSSNFSSAFSGSAFLVSSCFGSSCDIFAQPFISFVFSLNFDERNIKGKNISIFYFFCELRYRLINDIINPND